MTAIFEDLAWLGLALGEAGAAAIHRGSTPIAQRWRGWRRTACSIPASARARRSPQEIARASEAPHGPEGALYPGTCRHLSAE